MLTYLFVQNKLPDSKLKAVLILLSVLGMTEPASLLIFLAIKYDMAMEATQKINAVLDNCDLVFVPVRPLWPAAVLNQHATKNIGPYLISYLVFIPNHTKKLDGTKD